MEDSLGRALLASPHEEGFLRSWRRLPALKWTWLPALLLISLASCSFGTASRAVPSDEKEFATSALEDVALQRAASFRAKTLPTFRARFSEEATEKALHSMVEVYGSPLAWHYESATVGQVYLQDGTRLVLHRLWFAVVTTKHPKHLFAYVDIVPSDGRPALLSVSFVRLPKGIPEG